MTPIDFVVSGTGHRPNKLGGYSDANTAFLSTIAETWLKANTPAKVISGMALGWDMSLALATLRLNMRLVAAVPFEGQESTWPERSQKLYREVLNKASKVVLVTAGGYAPWKMHLRNQWMVDNCDKVLALYNGDPTGGTANCIRYAMLKNKPVDNVWDEYVRCKPS